MVTSQYSIIKTQIENIITYLEPFLPLANSHTIDYFTKSLFVNKLPENFRTEILNIGYENTLDLILNNKNDPKTPNLNKYISKTKSLHLYNLNDVCLTQIHLNKKLSEWGCENMSSLKLEVFVSPKKSHEVEILSKLIAAISYVNKTTHIIDLGDGKGYLSSLLALVYKIPVVGVDASLLNTNGAVKRVKQLQKVWKSLKTEPRKSYCAENNYQHFETTENLYKQVTQFVTEETNFEQLLNDVFLERNLLCGLVGLHTCGDLGSTSVKIFNNSKNIKTLCNVSCCYHLLSEKFEQNCENNHTNLGFPLSNFLKHCNFKIGRTARMLSSQSVDRILYKKELPNKTLFYRAIFEVLFEKYKSELTKKEVGKLRKEVQDFKDYAKIALKNIGATIYVSDKELTDLYNEYYNFQNQLSVFYLLRCMLAPVIEALILLDRLLFLHENNHESAFLLQLFDPIISPRCYGLIAFKNM